MNIQRVKKRCIELIERIERGGVFVHLALQQEAERSGEAPEEYPLINQIVRGVLEQRGAIEEILKPLLPKGLESLPERVQTVLKLGVYQIAFLDRVKKRDVVFEAVELVKEGKWRGFAGVVNAVLRKVEPLSQQEREDKATINFPEWLVVRWTDQFGEAETRDFCVACDRPLPLYLRMHADRIAPEKLQALLREQGVECQPAEWSARTLSVTRLPTGRRLSEVKGYREGYFFIQDLSSSLVAEIVSRATPRRVWDVCAAPGGKACGIALAIVTAGGVVTASDRDSKRVTLIDELVRRLQITNVKTLVHDALNDSCDDREEYDAVLVDAPCSGFGTAGRKADGRWSKSRETIAELVQIQTGLLDSVATRVRVGGALVYSTCTIDRAENEEVVQEFLRRHPDFSVSGLHDVLPPTLCTPEGFYRSWPHKHAMAGAFAAKLVRGSSR